MDHMIEDEQVGIVQTLTEPNVDEQSCHKPTIACINQAILSTSSHVAYNTHNHTHTHIHTHTHTHTHTYILCIAIVNINLSSVFFFNHTISKSIVFLSKPDEGNNKLTMDYI